MTLIWLCPFSFNKMFSYKKIKIPASLNRAKRKRQVIASTMGGHYKTGDKISTNEFTVQHICMCNWTLVEGYHLVSDPAPTGGSI